MSVVTLGKVHINDAGTDFRLEVLETASDDVSTPVDLSIGGTVAEMVFTDPSAVETTFTATIVLPGTDGIISYVNTDEAFLDDDSFWFYRAKITQGSTVFQSNDAAFEVLGKQQ